MHLRDEEVPLIGRAISREEFQRQLDANPRNGGMMLSEQQHEALVQTQTEQALSYIEDYLKDEFEITEPDFSDLTRIDLGYTTTEDEKHVIQVYADLEHCTVTKLVDDTLYAQERYGSLDDLNHAVLSNLDFDSLMEIDLDEAEEHEPQENALPTDESVAHDPTNYLAPYEPEVPTGAKAKFTANLNAIRTLKQIEQRGTPATEAEQDVLAGYLGWGGLADAFDPNKDNWHSEYEQLKDLLTPEEYAAAQESTLTAFYTPPAVIHAMYRALTRISEEETEEPKPVVQEYYASWEAPAQSASGTADLTYGITTDKIQLKTLEKVDGATIEIEPITKSGTIDGGSWSISPAGVQTVTTGGHTNDNNYQNSGGAASASWSVHYTVSKTVDGRSGSVGPYTTKEAADAAANSERDSAVAAIQAEAQSAVNNAIASAQAQLASLQFRYDEVTIPYGFESYWGSNGSHQTITVPANSNNAYEMPAAGRPVTTAAR